MDDRTDPQYKLRMPAELHQRLKEAAKENHRSLNAEIVARLQESFERGGGQVPDAAHAERMLEAARDLFEDARSLRKEAAEHRKDVAEILRTLREE